MLGKIILGITLTSWMILTFGMFIYMLYEYLIHPGGPWYILRGTCCSPIEWIPLFLLMIGVSGMIITGPIQLLNCVYKNPFHQYIGGLFVLFAVMTSFAGIFFMNFNETVGGPAMTTPFTVSGVLIFVYAMIVLSTGYYRQKKIHKFWVFRLYILGTASMFYRLLYLIAYLGYGSWPATFHYTIDKTFNWMFFIIPLFCCEVGILLYQHAGKWILQCKRKEVVLPVEGGTSSDESLIPEEVLIRSNWSAEILS